MEVPGDQPDRSKDMEEETAAASAPPPPAAAVQSFADLFPPLVAQAPAAAEREFEALAGPVDISTDDLALRPLEQQVEVHLYEALQRWNKRVAASSESTMGYMQRLKRYRAIVRWLLYENEDAHADDEGASTGKDPSPQAQRRAAKQQKKVRRTQIAMYKEIFGALPSIAVMRELRRPSARLEKFLEQFPAKKRIQQTKRSVADTQTSLCFEFARRPPPPTIERRNVEDKAAAGDENATRAQQETSDVQVPTASTAATWRSRTLLASMEEQQQTGTGEQAGMAVGSGSIQQELLLWIDVLHPSKDPARTQSFLVLGSQMLSNLLDLVVCAYDQRFEAQSRHSKLLYFDRQLYEDRRDDQNIDYSLQILTWIYAKHSRVEKYLKPSNRTSLPVPKLIETTTFAELALKIDCPGVYIHQGECEHLVRLRDVRLLDEETDSTNRDEDFPMRLPNPHQRQLRSCLICANYSAKFITYGDRMATTDPMFFCERCFRAAHYDREGNLLYTDFQAFPFIQE